MRLVVEYVHVRQQNQLFSYSDGTRRPRVDVLISCRERQNVKSIDKGDNKAFPMSSFSQETPHAIL